jgi:hypothetical protein
MSQKLGALIGWAQKLADRPALRLTPTDMADEMVQAAAYVREADRQTVEGITKRLEAQVARTDAMVERSRQVFQQRQIVWRMTAAGFVAGILLWSVLPGTLTRSLPARWHMPERLAARMLCSHR